MARRFLARLGRDDRYTPLHCIEMHPADIRDFRLRMPKFTD
ncbi:MAG TPA: hypothetical protein VL134_04340 [Leptolyngbya sp.]|nr:hypothetical protein [Leptolyngbya sp.]